MGTDLTTIEPLALPDRERPAQMPSLPAWLARRLDAIENDPECPKFPNRAAIPKAMMVGSFERAAIERYVLGLGRFLSLDQTIMLRDREMTNAQALGVMIAALLVKKGQRMDASMSESLTEDYLDALEDMPAWCVREAIRKWNRAESVPLDRKPHDFIWRPEPPTLRRLAAIERMRIVDRINSCQRLLAAEDRPVFTEEHRKHMLDKLSIELHRITDKTDTPAPSPTCAEEAA